MKSILFLGGVVQTIPFVEKAKKMGILTYVADNVENSPAKKIADIEVNIDCFDVESLEKYVNDNNIDGILVACADRLLESYFELCKRTNRPCYLNRDMLNAFNNKLGLKNILKKYNLPYVPEYDFNIKNRNDIDMIEFPCFIKPVDSNSSKGMSICSQQEDFDKCLDKALNASKVKNVLIEKVMDVDNIMIEYFFFDGKAYLRSICDRYVTHENKDTGTIPLALIYPSKYTDLYINTIHNKLIDIFNELDIKDGLLSFEAFVQNGQIMLYDPALRSTGAEEYVLYEKIKNIDLLKMLIEFSINSKTRTLHIDDTSYITKCAANLVIQIKTGKICKIDGFEKLNNIKSIINITNCHNINDVVKNRGTLDQTLMRIHIVDDSFNQLKESIKNILSSIKVYDENGDDMLMKQFDVKILDNYLYGGKK